MRKEKKEERGKRRTGRELNYLISLNLFLVSLTILLLASMPLVASYQISQYDKDYNTGVINNPEQEQQVSTSSSSSSDSQNSITGFAVRNSSSSSTNSSSNKSSSSNVTDIGKKCDGKSQKVSGIVKMMDNGIIKTLEMVASIMFLICTIASAIDTVINTVYNVLGCCFPNLVNGAACAYKEVEGRAWQGYFTPMVKTLCCFVNCGWCTGDGSCMGVLAGFSLGAIPGVVKNPNAITPDNPTGKVSGIGQFHISPYENIYTAVGCLCPIAILFNLRKLKTIYQVHDCCVQEACKNGMSTSPCDRQLSEATCMYWQGSLLKMLLKVLLSIITGFVYKWTLEILKQLGLAEVLYCPLALLDLTEVPSTIKGVMAAWKWTTTTFKEPSCSKLGFGSAKKQLESGMFSESEGISRLSLEDVNNDGKYDSLRKNYNSVKLTQKEKDNADWLSKELKTKNVEKVTGYDKDGKPVVMYKVESGFLKSEYRNADGKSIDSKAFMSVRDSLVIPKDFLGGSYVQGAKGGQLMTVSFEEKDGVLMKKVGNIETTATAQDIQNAYGIKDVKKEDGKYYHNGRLMDFKGEIINLGKVSQSLSFSGKPVTLPNNEEPGVYLYESNQYRVKDDKLQKFDVLAESGSRWKDVPTTDANIGLKDVIINANTQSSTQTIITSTATFIQTDPNTQSWQIKSNDGKTTILAELNYFGDDTEFVATDLPKVASIIDSIDSKKLEGATNVEYYYDGDADALILSYQGKDNREYEAQQFNIGGKNVGVVESIDKDGKSTGYESYVDGSSTLVKGPGAGNMLPLEVAQESFAKSKLGNSVVKTSDGGSYKLSGDKVPQQGTAGYKEIKFNQDGSYEYTEMGSHNIQNTKTVGKDGAITQIDFIQQAKNSGAESPKLSITSRDGKFEYFYYDEKLQDYKSYVYDSKTGKWLNENGKEAPKEVKDYLDKFGATAEVKKAEAEKRLSQSVSKGATSKEIELSNRMTALAQERVAYDLTWKLLNDILGSFAYKAIDDMCKKGKGNEQHAGSKTPPPARNQTTNSTRLTNQTSIITNSTGNSTV